MPKLAIGAVNRRFFITVLCFALINTAAWCAFIHFQNLQQIGILRVDDFEPGDNATVASPRPTLRWKFNVDVIPTSLYNRDPGTVTPAVPGNWIWENPRTLTFKPTADLPRATRVTFTLSDQFLRGSAGATLGKPFVTTMLAEPFGVRDIRQSANQPMDRYVIELTFNDRVAPGDVLQHLTATTTDGHPIKCELFGQATDKTVRVLTDSVPPEKESKSTLIKVSIAPGLAGLGGPLGLASPYSTTVNLSRGLAAVELTAEAPPRDQPYLVLKFNNNYDITAVKEILSIDPPVPFNLESYGDTEARLTGAFQCNTRYSVKLAAAPAGADLLKYPAPGHLSTFVPDRGAAVWFDNDQGYLSSGGNRALLAHIVNVSAVRVAVTRVYDNNLVPWRNAGGRYNWASLDRFAKPVAEKKILLSQEKNTQHDLRLSLDDLLPASSPRDGVYRISVSPANAQANLVADAANDESNPDDGDYDDYAGSSAVVTLSDIGLTAKQTRAGVTVWATSLKTAAPLANVRVRVFSSKSQPLGEGLTDASGLVNITDAPLAKGEIVAVIIADRAPAQPSAELGPDLPATQPAQNHSDLTEAYLAPADPAQSDLTWLDVRHSNWDLADADTGGQPYLRSGYEAFLYTDRGVYRPGEIVHLRAIVRGANHLAPDTTFPISWQIRRPDQHDWKTQTTMLDADGAASFDLQLSDDLPTGQWTACLGLPGATTDNKLFGTVNFQVEEFIPSRMKVSLNFRPSKGTEPSKGTGIFNDRAPTKSPNDPAAATGESPARANLAAGEINADIQADYLFGKPAAGLTAELTTCFDPIAFSPAGWDGWSFGDTGRINLPGDAPAATGRKSRGHGKAAAADASPLNETTLDATGHYNWQIDAADALGETDAAQSIKDTTAAIPTNRYQGPWRLTAAAGVRETGGRTITATQHIDLDLLPYYLAARLKDPSATPGNPCEIQLNLVRPDGNRADGNPTGASAKIEAAIVRETYNTTLDFVDGRYHYTSTRVLEPVTKETIAINAATGSWSPTIPSSGSYIASFRDTKTGAFTSVEFYATDGFPWDDNISRENPEHVDVTLMPGSNDAATQPSADRSTAGDNFAAGDNLATPTGPTTQNSIDLQTNLSTQTNLPKSKSAQKFRAGHTANVLIASPFAGRLLLTVETDDLLQTQVIDMKSTHIIVPIQVTDACRPNAFVTATILRPIDPNAKWQTHRAFGVARLKVDPADRTLKISLTGPAQIQPLQSLDINIAVTDSEGQPVANAAVNLAAVDEGICQMTDFATPDPVGYFNKNCALAVQSSDIFSLLMPEVPRPDGVSAVGGDIGSGASRHITPVVARRVKNVALAWDLVHTDANGNARASFSLPEFQGRLRVMAVAFDKTSTGCADKPVTVRSLVSAQSSWPRFAAPGDQFTVPILLFNNTNIAGNATVALDIETGPQAPTGLLNFGANHQPKIEINQITLAASGQNQIDIPVFATQSIGVARVHLRVEMNGNDFDEHLELPIRPAAPMMQFGGFVAASTTQPASLASPVAMLPGTGDFTIHVTPWPTLNLPQALDYLDRYPYGCVEQTTSAAFPLLALNDIGQQIDPKRLDPNAIKLKIDAGITQLIGMQTAEGGLAMWPGESNPWPWGSIYAAHFLVEAKKCGYEVPDDFYNHLLSYVRHQLDAGTDDAEELERQSYAGYVLSLAGKPDRAILDRLTELADAKNADDDDSHRAMRSDARLMLACAWSLAGRQDLAQDLLPDALPLPRSSREHAGNIGSPIRDRALLILTLATVKPNDARLPNLVQQLADAGLHHQWCSTQETAFAVLAIGRYLQNAPKPADFATAQLFQGDQLLASAQTGQSIDWNRPKAIPAATTNPTNQPDSATYIAKITGSANSAAYVSWLQTGVPLTPPADAFHGITIHRQYLTRDGQPLPSNIVATGDLIRVQITVEAPANQPNLVIEDLLPAGLEAENASLKTSTAADGSPDAASQTNDAGDPAKLPMFEIGRTDIRDDRVVFMGSMPNTGKARIEYYARAVTPGIYVMPPVRAEAMYDISENGLSGAQGKFTVLAPTPNIASIKDE